MNRSSCSSCERFGTSVSVVESYSSSKLDMNSKNFDAALDSGSWLFSDVIGSFPSLLEARVYVRD